MVEVEPTSIMGSTNIEDEYGRHTYHKVPNHLSPFMNASAMVIAVRCTEKYSPHGGSNIGSR